MAKPDEAESAREDVSPGLPPVGAPLFCGLQPMMTTAGRTVSATLQQHLGIMFRNILPGT